MKALQRILLFIVIVYTGCSTKDDSIMTIDRLTDGFCLLVNDSVVISHTDIEYYDINAHILYLKNEISYFSNPEKTGFFSIYANHEEIYKGRIWPGLSSSIHAGATIMPYFKANTKYIHIDFNKNVGKNKVKDMRNDERIVQALKKYNQFHLGLQYKIVSITNSLQHSTVEIQISNDDNIDYYYLDPERTGLELYHFYSNGLYFIRVSPTKTFKHHIKIKQPQPFDLLEKHWFSLIKSGEQKTMIISYNNFDILNSGKYKAYFSLGSPSLITPDKELNYKNGRIWLGHILMEAEYVK